MPLIDDLLALYHLDRQVRGLRGRVESAEIYLRSQQRQLDEVETRLAENVQRQKQHQAHIATLETETGSLDDRIDHLRKDLAKAETDKQYSALLAEINTHKDQRSAFENEELSEMSAVETLDATAKEIREMTSERTKLRDAAATELQERTEEIAEQLAELESERAIAADKVPGEALATFDEIADDYDGEAMAPIEVMDQKRREYACGCCSLMLPLDLVTSLLGNSETLSRCTACDRILFIGTETREAVSPKG
ncbi:MAG: hypothetical protein QGG74_03365 [Phycisphaerales bacterium]|jgi:predicted  nucleic acid-binding Zn-ribbon protein|nr:hypothetical protein [Phycisphaerales bacterium]